MIVSEDDYDIHQHYCLQDKYGNKKEYYEETVSISVYMFRLINESYAGK